MVSQRSFSTRSPLPCLPAYRIAARESSTQSPESSPPAAASSGSWIWEGLDFMSSEMEGS